MKQKTINFLRTCNLLEPMADTDGFPIISISKIFMWFALFGFIALMIAFILKAVDIQAVIGGVTAVATATGNYAHRRKQSKGKIKKASNIIKKI